MQLPRFIQPNWPAPSNVAAYTSCRTGGNSAPPYNSFNLGQHVGDDPQLVTKNRQLLPNGENFVWLNQTHSNTCVDLTDYQCVAGDTPLADACCTNTKQQVCAVMTADCLPILLCDPRGTSVAAIHAGWRGLADGVIENTVSKMAANSATLMAWMGPAISQKHFEVGPEIKDIFNDYPQAFRENHQSADIKYFCDIYEIAKHKMMAIGISQIYGGEYCTYTQSDLFFSHRRVTHQALNGDIPEAKTGRIVSAIYLK